MCGTRVEPSECGCDDAKRGGVRHGLEPEEWGAAVVVVNCSELVAGIVEIQGVVFLV